MPVEWEKYINPIYLKDDKGLEEHGLLINTDYLTNSPFPHISLDNLFNEEYLESVMEEVATLETFEYEKNFYGSVKKRGQSNIWSLGPKTRELLFFLNSPPFLKFIESLTSIDKIIPDPYFSGGGFHEILNGGFLKMHTDFNWHEGLLLDRRINLLIYLNKNWDPKWGGDLCLSNSKLSEVKKISPSFNRTAIFSTTDHSFHGHPDPLDCPDSETRKSIAVYYYSKGRPPGEAFRGKNTRTKYIERPQDNFQENKLKVMAHDVFDRLPEALKKMYRILRK